MLMERCNVNLKEYSKGRMSSQQERHCMENLSITLLFVEDNRIDQTMFTRFVKQEHLPYVYTLAGSVHDAKHLLATGQQFDIAIMDYMLGDGTAFDILEKLQNIPTVLITGIGDEEIAVRAMKAGVYDYLIKDVDGNYLKTLPVTVDKALHRKQTEEALKTYQNHLEELVKARTAELEAEILERKRIEEEVRTLNAELEHRVEKRTIELRIANQELLQSLETLRKTQEQLIQSEKMAALGGLVAGIAHEINTPVGVSITAASHLEEQTKEIVARYHHDTIRRSELEHYLHVADQVSRMLLLNLQFAADQIQIFKQVAVDQTSSEKRRFHLKSYLNDVFLSLHPKLRNSRHIITVNCPDTLYLNSYPGAFSQIVSNFVLNSLVHGFEFKEQGEITLDITMQADCLQMCYADNGKGISSEDLPRIFEPFYTTKRGRGGSGLGLHIVYNLVTQQLQGTIICDSQLEGGTRFLIRIPLSGENSTVRR